MSSKKSVKCKICGRKYVSKQALIDHIEKAHSDSIPEGWNAARYENFLRTGKTEGHCVYCKKETGWNNATGKYNRMCGSEECKKAARELANKNYIGLHGKPYSINNPEQQKKMIYGRKNSGTYVFEDEETGKKYKVMYDSSYGKDFFEMLDLFLNWDGSDIIAPSPHTYYYEYEGKKHFYIPDAYSTSLNLEIELKDGGDNPNKHPKIQAVDKVKEQKKDEVMKSLKGQVNYIKICNKDYSEFFALLSELREKDECQLPKWESKLESVTEGYGVNNEPDIDTVIFDFGSVLDKNMSDEKIYEYYETYMKPDGITENEFLALKKDYYDYTDDADNESLSYEALLRLYEAHVDEKYRKYVKDMIDIYTDSIQLQDYAVPMLDYLTDMGYKIYYLSNQSRYCWDKHSYIYDPIMHYFIDGIISYKVDLVKPDIRIYELLIEKTGLNPNSSIFFDDREDNVEASIQAGIYAERFTRETVERIMSLPRVNNRFSPVKEEVVYNKPIPLRADIVRFSSDCKMGTISDDDSRYMFPSDKDDILSSNSHGYDDYLSKSGYDMSDLKEMIESSNIVELYNAYANFEINRIMEITKGALSGGKFDSDKIKTTLDDTIIFECSALLTGGVFTEEQLREYMTHKYFDIDLEPEELRKTLSIRYDYNRRITQILQAMLVNNYQILGYTEEEAKRMVDNLSTKNKKITFDEVIENIKRNNNFIKDNTIDLRSLGGGIIYLSNYEVTDDLLSEQPSALITSAINYAFEYDVVFFAHGVYNDDMYREIPKFIDQLKPLDFIQICKTDYPNDSKFKSIYSGYREDVDDISFGISDEDVYKRYVDTIGEIYHLDDVASKFVKSGNGNRINFDKIPEMKDDLNKFVEMYNDWYNEDEVNANELIRKYKNLKYWYNEFYQFLKGKRWLSQNTKIGKNNASIDTVTNIRNIIKEHPDAKTIMVLNCNPDHIKLPVDLQRSKVKITISNNSTLADVSTNRDLRHMYTGESYIYESDEFEFDSILESIETDFKNFASENGIDYYDDESLMEAVNYIESGMVPVTEGVAGKVWNTLVKFVKTIIKAIVAIFKAVINFFKTIFNKIKNFIRSLLGLPTVNKNISYIALESATIDTFKPRTNKDIDNKIRKACEKMGRELQTLSKTQTKILAEIKKNTEKQAREHVNESVNYITESSSNPYKGLIKRDYQLKNPTLNYDDLILYYRNQLFHKNLTELEWQCTYNELINVRGYLKKVINKGRGEYDERMVYEARKALKQVNNFIQYMEEENKRKKPVTEKMDTFLTTNPFEKQITLYHGSHYGGKLDVIQPVSRNVGNRFNEPRCSSFWTTDKQLAINFAIFKLVGEVCDINACYSMDGSIYTMMKISESEVINKLKNEKVYVYTKTIDKKWIGRGHAPHMDEYTIDVPVKPDKCEEFDSSYIKDNIKGRIKYIGTDDPKEQKRIIDKMMEEGNNKYPFRKLFIFHNGETYTRLQKEVRGLQKGVSEAVTESKTNQNCVIISCFAGVGKNYAMEYFKKKGLVVNSLEKERDFYKIHKNPETDVAKHIHELSKKSDILFIPYYLEMEARHLNGQVDYYLVYPKLSEKHAFIKRFKELGFSDDQVRYLSENWEAMISDCDNCNIPEDRKISIDRDTYLTDVIETQILGTTISETITMESGDKSTLDKNFKKKSGGNFEFIDLHDPRAKKYLTTDAYYKENFENIYSTINGEIVVDKDKDKLAGYIYVGGGDKSKNRNYGFIQTLEVRKEYRGYGLSDRLLNDAIRKHNAVDLTVYKDNEVALNLYKKHGFVIIGYGNSKDNSDYWMKLKTKLSKDDKILNESVTMESTHSDKVPVYIVSWNYDSVIGVGAKVITGSLYNHTSVSLTPDLEECYAFSRLPENLGDNPGGGFCREKLSYMVSKHKNARIKVDAVYVSRKTYDKMKKLIKEYENHQADTKFDYMDFVRIILGIEDNDLNDKNLVCSVFVDHLFKASGFDLTNGKKSNLVTPADLSVVDKNHSNIVTVYSGKAVDYDKRKIGRISFESTLTGHKDIFEPGDFAEYAKYADLDSAREEIEDDKGNYINYQNTNNGVDIMETKFKSNIDKDYKSKGFKSLNSFRKQPINKTFINKYKSEVKLLGDVDKTEYGFAWMDGDNLVGYCMANDFGWLTAIEITNPYKGYGLGEQMLKYAIRNMGVNRLGVHKDNKIAYELYRKNGFKEVPSEMINGSTDKDLIFMTTDRVVLSKVSESTHIEGERDGEKRFPVFVFLTYTDTNIAKVIKGFTHDPYAHSSLSFDTNLDNMLSFDYRGFVKENIHTDIYKKKINDVRYSLYMYMASDKEYRSMHSFIDELNEHRERLRYNLLGLTNFIFGKGSEREDRFFCSEFVSACIQAGNDGIIKTKSYLTTPCMLVKNNNFQFIKRGSLKNYNVKEIDNIVKSKLEEWGYTNVKLN